YNAVPPPAADLYLSPKKDLSWTGLPEFVDDIVTDYSRPSSTVASTSVEGQNKDSFTFEDVASPNTPKPFVKFVKSKDSQSESPEFVLNKKACFNCGDFSHLANDCRKRVQRDTTRRIGHLNVKIMNKLVRQNLVRGLPTKSFDNDHTCPACLKGKKHKASCKSKSKDETSDILMKFITEIENLKDLKVKIIRCDNRGEFRNKEMNDFCSRKGIKREFSNARTPQQNGVAEKRNKTLIEAARTMLADVKLPVTF
nr:hypothetical protein [Tanacetum cinerariifolium]